jgi:hypothetical protein
MKNGPKGWYPPERRRKMSKSSAKAKLDLNLEALWSIFYDCRASVPCFASTITVVTHISHVLNDWSTHALFKQVHGSVFGDDIPFLIGAPLVDTLLNTPANYSAIDRMVSEVVMTQWTNFAKSGYVPYLYRYRVCSFYFFFLNPPFTRGSKEVQKYFTS